MLLCLGDTLGGNLVSLGESLGGSSLVLLSLSEVGAEIAAAKGCTQGVRMDY